MGHIAKLLIIALPLFIGPSNVEPFEAAIIFVRGEEDYIAEQALLKAIEDHNLEEGGLSLQFINARGRIPKNILDPLCQILESAMGTSQKAPIIFDVTKTGVPSETVKAFASALAIPIVSTSYGHEGDIKAWLSLHPDEEKYLIQLTPPNDIFVEIITALVRRQNITNFALLHDETFVMTGKELVFTQSLNVRSAIKLITLGDLKHQLKDLYAFDYRNFFIMAKQIVIEEVLAMANELRYLTRGNWYAGIFERREVTCDCDGSVILMRPQPLPEAVAKLRQINKNNLFDEVNTAFYYDFFSKGILGVKALAKEGKWPPVTDFVNCAQFSEGKVKPRPNLDLRAAMKQADDNMTFAPWQMDTNGNSFMKFTVNLQKVTFSTKKQQNDVVVVGSWVAGFSNPVHPVADQLLSSAATPLRYRVVTNAQPPFVMRNSNPALGPPFYGLCIDLLQELSQRLGFEYYIYEVADEKMGYIDDNGDWSGIVGDLIDKKADIGIASISIMAERERVIDFSIPYYDLVGISILMKKSQTPTSLFKFLTVLEADVWLCILAAYFITSFLMWVFDRWSPYSYQNNKEKYKDDEEKRIFSFKECLWFCMTSLTPQGGGEAPKNLSGRLVAATWWLFGFIIMASYTANLAAFLTVSRLDTPIESLDDLSKQYKIGYAPINGTAEMRYFERMAAIENRFYEIWKDMSLNDSLSPYERSKLAVWDYPVSDKFTKMWQAMGETGLPHSIEEALVRIRGSRTSNEGFALLGDSTDNKYYYATSCDLQVVGDEFSRKPYAIALQEGSPLRIPINNVLQDMINEGRLNELKAYWWKNVSTIRDKCEILNEEVEGISIKNIGGVFIVIFLGIGGAMVALTMEYGWHQYQRSKTVKTATTSGEGWRNSSNYSEGGFQRQRTEEGFSNRYLDPLNLYGDQVMRRTNVQRAFPW